MITAGAAPWRRPALMDQASRCGGLLIVFLVLFLPFEGTAQVTTDITSSGLNTHVNQVGNSFDITGGTRPGGGPNLFHSFGRFDVGQTNGVNDIANFLNDSGIHTTSILARITDPNISQIYGTIRTTGYNGAHLFLMNPSGFVLGPSASLDVNGAVSFTTAQYLRLFDGATNAYFYANPAKDGLANSILDINASAFEFLSASPTAYGFLTAPDPNATITIQGSLLKVPEGQSLSLVGGNITLQSDILGDGTTQAANLQAPGGRINLVSVASPGEVLPSNFQPAPNINGVSFSTMGAVTLKEGTVLDVSGQFDGLGIPIGNGNSGTVFVRGGQLVMDASAIQANTVGAVDGSSRAVDIQVSQEVALSNGSSISVGTSGSGRGGDVVMVAGNGQVPGKILLDASSISTQTVGLGRGGDVLITADTVTLQSRSGLSTATFFGDGAGGDIFLNVGQLKLLGDGSGDASGGSSIRTDNFSFGTDLNFDGVVDVIGVGGSVTVQGRAGASSAANSVELSGGSGIISESGGVGTDGGRISITAQSLNLDEASQITSSTTVTGIDLDGDGTVDITGRGGDIVAAVKQLSVTGRATIESFTGGLGVTAADGGTVTVQGLEGSGSKADSVLLSGQHTGIFSTSSGGLPGDITVDTGILTITNGAVIAAGSSLSDGPGGAVTITADSVVISADGQVFSRSFAQQSGQVTITADKLTLDNGSIDTSTSSEFGGRGGDIVLNGGTVTLTNGASINSQSGSAEDQGRFSTGRAGDIIMNVDSLSLANLSKVTSSSKGTVADAGDAGNITIQSRSTVLLKNSLITTEAIAASGGQIVINAPDMIQLVSSQVSTSVKDGTGGGGNITIDPDFVILKDSQILAQAFAGNGGAIDITTGLFLADASSVVDASSTRGISGTVEINAPINNVAEVVARLPESLLTVETLLRAACAARLAEGDTSSFVERGRDSLPAGPEGLLASPYLPLASRPLSQVPTTQSHDLSQIYLRHLPTHASPAPILIRTDHSACSS